jgi:hypothetical protein
MFSHQYYGAHKDAADRLWAKLGEIRDRRSPALFAKYAR